MREPRRRERSPHVGEWRARRQEGFIREKERWYRSIIFFVVVDFINYNIILIS